MKKNQEKMNACCKIKTNVESGIGDYQFVSNSAEFQYILQHGDTYSQEFKFGSHWYGEAHSQRFE